MKLSEYYLRIKSCSSRLWLVGVLQFSIAMVGSLQAATKEIEQAPKVSKSTTNSGAVSGTLADDVTQPFGIYHYEKQEGIYKNATAGELAQDFVSSVVSVGSLVRNINSYAGWGSSAGGFRWNVAGGAGGAAPIGYGLGLYGEYQQNQDINRLAFALGPLTIDGIYAGYGLIYNDVNGASRRESYAEDDQIGDILWLSARTSLVLGNFALSVQPFVYWLPQTGEVGWGMPGPFAGMLMGAGLGAQSLAQAVWAKETGRWRLAAYDLFSPQVANYNIGQIAGGAQYFLGDLTPIDRVGRYSLGYGAGNLQNYDPTLASIPGENRTWRPQFFNVAGLAAYCDHSPVVQSTYYFNRIDMWDDGFQHARAIINGGAAIRASDGPNQIYSGYEFQSGNPYDQFFHTAYAGMAKQMGPNIYTYAVGRYIWITGLTNTYQTYGGAVGLRQQLGVESFHAIEAGRGVFNPGNQALGIEDYIQYRIGHQLGPRSSLQGYAGISNRRQDFVTEQDSVVRFCGAQFQWFITDRATLFASALYQDIEVEPIQRWNSRIYTTGITHLISKTTTGNCFYQYEDTRGTLDFTEHSLFIGISKEF